MPQLVRETKVEVRDGELIVSINLDLNINLNTNAINIAAAVSESKEESKEGKWELPDFKNISKVKFGKVEQ